MELLSGFGKRGVKLGLLTKQADVEDTDYLSKYFVVQKFSSTFTAGKNSIEFNGSELLKPDSEVLVECLDSSGSPLYIESTTKTSITYKESATYVLAIHVYAETSNGAGKIVLYGTLKNGFTVKWIANIIIDKTLPNSSTVRFYSKPTLEVQPILSPVLASVGGLNKTVILSGSFYSFAVTPSRDNLKINKKNVNVDYRIFLKNAPVSDDPTGSFNFQLENNKIDIRVRNIQEPYSYKNTPVNFTSSFNVKKVLNSSTIILDDVVSYHDSKKNDVIVNIVDGDFFVNYKYILYNTASESSSYLVSNTSEGQNFIKQSFADIIYKNLKTFSGFIARHKVYRKSLFSPGDFEVISDEPLVPYEILQDKLTTNKSFDKLGEFYSKSHVNKYWFVNGTKLQLTQSSNKMIDAVIINYTGSNSDLISLSDYVIVKGNVSQLNRNSTYYPYDKQSFINLSGSSYDSNFVDLKKNVDYVLSLNVILKKDFSTISDPTAALEFYLSSSIEEINNEPNCVKSQRGLLKIGSIIAYEPLEEKVLTNAKLMFNTTNDLYGTLVVVPRKCTAIVSDLSLKPYGDFGFSPDTLITRIPFPVNIANEGFEIKSELFDINSTLVYSDLRTIATFDPSGSSMAVFIPGMKDPSKTTFLSGSLEISQSLWVGENAYITGSLTIKGPVIFNTNSGKGIVESLYNTERMLAWDKSTGKVSYTNLKDVDHYTKDELTFKLYGKGTDIETGSFRLIPSIKGRNVFVAKSSAVVTTTTPIQTM